VTLEGDLIWYIASRSLSFGVPVTKTRLVKYLYLVDLVVSRDRRRRATDLSWIYYDYGPYPVGFESLLTEELGSGHARLERLPRGGPASGEAVLVLPVLRPVETLLPNDLKNAADAICSHWANWDLNVLLNYVYFDTPPMRKARRGQDLDLLVENDRSWPVTRGPLEAPPVPDSYRRRLAEARERQRHQLPRRAVRPTPRWDDVYREFLSETRESEDDLTGLRGRLHSNAEEGSE